MLSVVEKIKIIFKFKSIGENILNIYLTYDKYLSIFIDLSKNVSFFFAHKLKVCEFMIAH